MASITLGGNPCTTIGNIPTSGAQAPDFNICTDELAPFGLADMKGKKVILNIFPSVDTGVCAASARKFNAEASSDENTHVYCVSRDLPFAQKRFCAAEGLERVHMLSDFKDGSFGDAYGLTIADGPFAGLHSRVVVALDEQGKVIYSEQVAEIGEEPDYTSALAAVRG